MGKGGSAAEIRRLNGRKLWPHLRAAMGFASTVGAGSKLDFSPEQN
jgi:hypothetical protein